MNIRELIKLLEVFPFKEIEVLIIDKHEDNCLKVTDAIEYEGKCFLNYERTKWKKVKP